MIIPIQGWLFFTLLGGSAFTLRGIWGHNIGGGVMGILMGLGLGVLLDLPVLFTIELMFWLGIAWAISSFFGWARHATVQRFLRGYLIYGMFPNILVGLFLFQGNLPAIVTLAVLGSLGMGIGFGISYRLLDWLRGKIKDRYNRNHSHEEPKIINWGVTPLKEGEVSHIYITRLDTWKVFFEILSGALFAITSLVVFSIYPIVTLPPVPSNPADMAWYHVLMLIVCFILIPAGLADGIITRKQEGNTFRLGENQQPWNTKKVKSARLILLVGTLCWGIMFFVLIQPLFNVMVLFLVFYWVTNGIARVVNPLDSKFFQTDCIIDIALGILISALLIFQ